MKKSLIIFSIIGILFCSCVPMFVDPGYHQKNGFTSSGYLDTRVTEDSFMITFIGDSNLSKDECEKYALRRAAEVTHHSGFEYFKVLDEELTVSQTKHKNSSLENTANEGEKPKKVFNTSVYTKSYPTIRMKIKCYDKKPRGDNVICAYEYLQYNFPQALS